MNALEWLGIVVVLAVIYTVGAVWVLVRADRYSPVRAGVVYVLVLGSMSVVAAALGAATAALFHL